MKPLMIWVMMALLPLGALAAEPLRTISVQGEAKRDVAPDEAQIDFTMHSEAKELADVKRMQDEKLATLYQLAGEYQIEKKHLKTQYMQIHPQYRYDNNRQYLQGYDASTSVSIRLLELGKVADVTQALVNAGFDRLNQVQYLVGDAQPILEELELEALKNARSKANAMASAMDMQLGTVIQIIEGGAQRMPIAMPSPMMEMAVASSGARSGAAMAPPAGEEELHASISVTFELKPILANSEE